MRNRLKSQFKLHRLWQEPVSVGFTTFIDGEGEGNAGGADDGGGEGGTGAGGASGGTGGEGSSGGEGSAGKAGDGKPSDAEAKLLKDLMKQKTAREAAETRMRELDTKLKEFEGIDPKAVKDLLAKKADEERKQLEAKGEYDRIVKQMADAHAAEIQREKEQIENAKRTNSALQQQIADLTVGQAFSGSQFVKEDLTLTATKARVVYGSYFEFKDGKVVGYDKPVGASDRTPLVDGQGNTLAFDEALKKIVDSDPDKDYLLRSKAKPGAGSGTAKGKGVSDPKPMTSIQKISKGLKSLASK